MTHTVLMRHRLSLMLLLALLAASLAGCGLGAADELTGRWVGVPDTSAARAQREAAKYQELVAASGGDASATSADSAAPAAGGDRPQRPAVVTDWEQFDVEVALDFVDSDTVRMQISGEATGEPVVGQWKVVESGPAGLVIEVRTPGVGDAAPPVRRRFEIELDRREQGVVGFTLNEVGADRRLGSLYFRRAK